LLLQLHVVVTATFSCASSNVHLILVVVPIGFRPQLDPLNPHGDISVKIFSYGLFELLMI